IFKIFYTPFSLFFYFFCFFFYGGKEKANDEKRCNVRKRKRCIRAGFIRMLRTKPVGVASLQGSAGG
ncbi:hypothetical protein J8855_27120, partial [Klebsiella pneumoniae]